MLLFFVASMSTLHVLPECCARPLLWCAPCCLSVRRVVSSVVPCRLQWCAVPSPVVCRLRGVPSPVVCAVHSHKDVPVHTVVLT